MLNGLDPIIIFNFKRIVSDVVFGPQEEPEIPIVAEIKNMIDLPRIPIYLSENLTGIYIDTESKSLEINTDIDTVSSGDVPKVNQRAITNTVKIEMIASKDSLGVLLFSALADLIFPKVTSKEYTITYLHGAVTVFGGLLHSFSINQESSNELYKISLELIKPSAPPKLPIVKVPVVTGAGPL